MRIVFHGSSIVSVSCSGHDRPLETMITVSQAELSWAEWRASGNINVLGNKTHLSNAAAVPTT